MTALVPDGQFTGATRHFRLVAGITLAETTYTGGLTIAAHAHPTTLVVLMLDGSMTEFRGRAGLLCPVGTLLVHPREEPHSHVWNESGGRQFIMQLGTDWMQRMKTLGVTEPNSPVDLRQTRANAIAGELYAEFRQADDASRLGIEGYALAMLGELTRARMRVERSARPPWLRRAADLLHASAGASVEMADIAAEVNVSPVHLARSFKEHFGSTMSEYLRRLRVERAREQLLSSSKPLSQIAVEAGFADQAHFTRTFKQLVGATPGAYRRSTGVDTTG
jgi:AraC family transcriptional regulator